MKNKDTQLLAEAYEGKVSRKLGAVTPITRTMTLSKVQKDYDEKHGAVIVRLSRKGEEEITSSQVKVGDVLELPDANAPSEYIKVLVLPDKPVEEPVLIYNGVKYPLSKVCVMDQGMDYGVTQIEVKDLDRQNKGVLVIHINIVDSQGGDEIDE